MRPHNVELIVPPMPHVPPENPTPASPDPMHLPAVAAATFEAVPTMIVVVDRDGRILIFNPACQKATGFGLEEIRGRLICEVLKRPEDRESFRAVLAGLLNGTTPSSFESVWLTKDGGTITIAWNTAVVRGPDGQVSHVIGAGTDVSARHWIEHELQENEAFYTSVLSTAPDGIVTIDGRGRIRSFNRAAERIFGYRADEVIGKNVSLLMPTPYREAHDGYLDRYHRTGEKRIIGIGRLVQGLRRDGSTFPLELAVGEVEVDGAKYFTGFVRDISAQQQDRKRAHELQAELAQMSRVAVAGEMSAVLAHEVSQPLAAVSNYLQAVRRMLEAPKADKTRIAEMLGKGIDQAQRAGDIVRRLRDFTRRGAPERSSEDLSAIVEEAAGLALIGTDKLDLRVQWLLARDLPPVMIDRIQIQQVILNLMRNALDALKDAARREISVATRLGGDGTVEIRVADSGGGIPADVKSRLFSPFLTTKAGGTGIGLRISLSIVEAHGGRLWAEDNPGGGAVFAFTLPIVPDEATP